MNAGLRSKSHTHTHTHTHGQPTTETREKATETKKKASETRKKASKTGEKTTETKKKGHRNEEKSHRNGRKSHRNEKKSHETREKATETRERGEERRGKYRMICRFCKDAIAFLKTCGKRRINTPFDMQSCLSAVVYTVARSFFSYSIILLHCTCHCVLNGENTGPLWWHCLFVRIFIPLRGGGGVCPPVIASCTIPLHLFHRRIRFPAWRGQWCVSSGRRRCVLDRLFGVCVRFGLSGSPTKRRPFTDIYFHFKKKRSKVKGQRSRKMFGLKIFNSKHFSNATKYDNQSINRSIQPVSLTSLMVFVWKCSDGSEQSVFVMEWGHFMTNLWWIFVTVTGNCRVRSLDLLATLYNHLNFNQQKWWMCSELRGIERRN